MCHYKSAVLRISLKVSLHPLFCLGNASAFGSLSEGSVLFLSCCFLDVAPRDVFFK